MKQNETSTDFFYDSMQSEMEKNLFVNLKMPMETVKRILSDKDIDREKTFSICRDLMLHQPDLFEDEKQKQECIMQRIAEWTEAVGRPDERLLLAMHERWRMPMNKMMKGRLSPASVKRLLDQYIVGQEAYKEQIAVAFCMHLSRVDANNSFLTLPRSSLLVHGPTGCGKTHGLQILGKLFDLPLVVVHCNNLVPEGYIGQSISDAFTDTFMQTKSEKAMLNSIVLFDEDDKLLKANGSANNREYAETVLNEMLSITDTHGEVVFNNAYGHGKTRVIHLPTENMMFVYTGVFEGLESVVAKRLHIPDTISGISFSIGDSRITVSTFTSNELRSMANEYDFVELGMKPELMGRIGNIVSVEELTMSQLAEVLDKARPSLIQQYVNFFENYGINLQVTDDGKRRIAEIASELHFGARGLGKVLGGVLTDAMTSLDVADDGAVRELTVDEEYVNKRFKLLNI